jgi:hypothetical protein
VKKSVSNCLTDRPEDSILHTHHCENLKSYVTQQSKSLLDNAVVSTTDGARGSVVVKALFYKPEGCGFDS